MSSFNFSSLATTSGISSTRILSPFEIHDVKLEEAKFDKIEGKNGDAAGKIFDVIKVRFSNDQGYYEESLFLPTSENDTKRQPNAWGGEQPSAFDRFKMFIAHVSRIVNPEGFESLKQLANDGKIKSVNDLATIFLKIINAKIGKELKLKLIGRNNNGLVRASLPYFVAINKDHVEYLNNMFLSDPNDEKSPSLSFNASELKKKNEFASLKPTNMDSVVTNSLSSLDSIQSNSSEDNSDLLDLIK